MASIIYEEYPYTNGERKDEKLNKRIISLARRHKFYLDNIKSVFGLSTSGRWYGCAPSYQVVIAKKLNRKGDDYKVVGFIIMSGKSAWSKGGDRMCMSLEYWLVDKKFQGQGIGKALYGEMEKKAELYGLSNYVVMYKKDDEKLRDLYTKLGYEFIPKYDGYENTTNRVCDKHLKVYKITITHYRIPHQEELWDLLA